MKYQKKSMAIQQLANGEIVKIYAHIFTSSKPGPTIYVQGNLHGPEVFGTALLIELVQEMKKNKDFKGKIVIVPCANPMGVNNVVYNGITGRWNQQSGTNWNRIFSISPLKNRQEEIVFYDNLLKIEKLSIESKLAAMLRSLSAGADYVLDIHTTGIFNTDHLFTYSWMSEDFSALQAPVHLLLDPKTTVCAFDESHVIPFLKSLTKKEVPKVATWEAHSHGYFDNLILKQRLSQLLNWLRNTWGNESKQNNKPAIFKQYAHLTAPVAGYYCWTKKVGERVCAGESYARVYQPNSGDFVFAKAENDFVLLGIYGVVATASGEQIGWVAK
ncbi:MAG: succinylglutamate desuccinylase/aspartoacylase family protein [Parcubacteria group bacterium]|nr:succinylglutamate desuccinylase/aspartoacylase family protein [Parcubacteria group bacterium]